MKGSAHSDLRFQILRPTAIAGLGCSLNLRLRPTCGNWCRGKDCDWLRAAEMQPQATNSVLGMVWGGEMLSGTGLISLPLVYLLKNLPTQVLRKTNQWFVNKIEKMWPCRNC
jgi:hypothetical protein